MDQDVTITSVREASSTVGQDSARKTHPTNGATTSKVTPFSPDEAAQRSGDQAGDSRRSPDPRTENWRDRRVDDFGTLVTAAIKAKNWGNYVWQGILVLCVTGTFAVLETSNPLLLTVCMFVGVSLVSVEAYQACGVIGMVLALVFFVTVGWGTHVLSKKIDMMEVWSEMFEQADVEIGLEELKNQQLALDEAMEPEQSQKKERETNLLGPPQMNVHYEVDVTGGLDSMMERASGLKKPFEERILKVLAQASSHHEIWLELYPSEGGTSHSGAGATVLTIEANLKAKPRAREKAVMDYSGDISKLKDMLRASVLCRNMKEVCSVWQAVEGLQQQGILIVIIVKNRFRGKAHDTGYRDLNVVVAFEGFLCEIQIHSVQHYGLKKYQHPTYTLCRSYGLVGKLETASPATILTHRPKLSMQASVTIFVIRALAAIWSFVGVAMYLFYSVPEVADGFFENSNSVNTFDVDYLGDIEEGWIRRWKQGALAVPYMLVCALLVVDMARASKVQLCIFTVLWAAVVGLFCLMLVAFDMSLLAFCQSLLPLLLTWIVLAVALHRYQQQRVPQVRRIGLLYAQYFGVNGSLFPLKVILFQAATVTLQTLGKLLLLGEVANMKTQFFDETFGHAVYWLFLTLLGLNATVPALLLQAESVFWQRVAVCYLDIFFDLMYTLVFGVYLVLTFFYGAIAPTDAISFGSSLLPLLHILSVARAIEMPDTSAHADAEEEVTKRDIVDKRRMWPRRRMVP